MPHQSAKETSALHTFTSPPKLLLDCLTKLKTEMVSTCYKNNFFRLGRKKLCFEKRAVFRERTSRKALRTGDVQGKISEHRFKVKSGEGGGGIVLIILRIFFRNTRPFENWKMSLGYSSVLAGVYSVT